MSLCYFGSACPRFGIPELGKKNKQTNKGENGYWEKGMEATAEVMGPGYHRY